MSLAGLENLMGYTVPPLSLAERAAFEQQRQDALLRATRTRKAAAAALSNDPVERWILEGGTALYSEFLLEEAAVTQCPVLPPNISVR